MDAPAPAADAATQPSSSPFYWPLDPGPSWNVPRISLPGCMGVLTQYQTEWWYYVGHAVSAGGEELSLQFEFLRAALDGGSLEGQVVAGLVGIGTRSTGSYLWAPAYGFSVADQIGMLGTLTVLPASDAQYSLEFAPLLGTRLSVAYTGGGPLATVGSTYRLTASGEDAGTPFTADLSFTDRRGLVMEGSSGFVGPGMFSGGGGLGAGSYEFAQPRLEITGGTVEIGGVTHTLVGGMLWCDRQALTNPTPPSSLPEGEIDRARPDLALAKASSALYRGSWLAVTLHNGVSLALATFWQPPAVPDMHLQWVTGTRVGRPPLGGFGTVYLPGGGSFAGRNGGQPIQGADAYGTHDFDVNILDPRRGDQSPHWQSTASGHTYSTGWWLSFDPRLSALGVPENLYLRAVVDGCENLLPLTSGFWEGAANIYATREGGEPIGHAFVEQMGYD
jgi:hypothetical protein